VLEQKLSAVMEEPEHTTPEQTDVDQPVATVEVPVQGKKQLSEAQKASLAKAREKARQTKLAKSEAKREEEKKFNEWQQKQQKKDEEELPDYKTQSESDSQPPTPPPKRKSKKGRKTKRSRRESSSDESSDDEPVKISGEDHMKTVRAAYDANVARYKNDLIYKSMFPFL